MKKIICLLSSSLLLAAAAHAKTITVNTVDNTDFTAGKTNMVKAIGLLADGDTINFNIPGGGVKYIATPAGGYAFITNNSVTIDGYSQPGASANTHGIHEANNAQLKVVLDSRNGAGRPMGGASGVNTLTDTNTWGAVTDSGWGVTEVAILPLYKGTNIHVKGIAFLASYSSTEPAGGDMKCVCIATTVKSGPDMAVMAGTATGWHISGCWFGVDPATGQIDLTGGVPNSGTICIATYGCKQAAASNTVYAVNGTIGVAKNSLNPRAEFNVILGGYGADLVGYGHRYSGNFANVLPDGLHSTDFSQLADGAQQGDGDFECGGNGVANLTIGTDGDGVNDAEEGNVFGGSVSTGWRNVYMYSGPRTNIVVAGNYVGVGIDGATRFTNACRFVKLDSGTATARVGSDFDGVSDSLEANVIFNSWPFTTAYPSPIADIPNKLFDLNTGTRLSFRGNKTVGNTLLPFNYANGTGSLLAGYTSYETPYMSVAGDLTPVLSITNTFPHLTGTFPKGGVGYTTVILDVYELDAEGWTNGQEFNLLELVNPLGGYFGFPQGRKYLGSFTVPNEGSFNIVLPTGSGAVTVTANYSADPAGTHNGRVHTGNFSNPGYIIPGGASSVGLTQVVPDVACWYDSVGNYVTNGFINLANQPPSASLGNWEPFVSSVGDSTFLVEFNTYANDGTFTKQNNAIAKQPAAGGAAKVDYAFYADNGTPFKGPLNLSRQNGNPGRVAGDQRYGANKFITEAEVSLGQLIEFQTGVNRWQNNDIYFGLNRYPAEQIFTLNPTTLAQTPVSNAWDYVYGPFDGVMGLGNNAPQVGRTGGRPNFLDNGNIVVMIDDKSCILSPAGEVTSFAIIQPNGTVVKGPTLAKAQDIFDNMCSVKGGFVIRVHDSMLFYNNSGNLTFSNSVNVSSGMNFGGSADPGGRGDAHRIGGDIRSYYVFVAGKVGAAGKEIGVAAWDTRTGQFVGGSIVSDGDPVYQSVDRTSVAVDALNRVCVTYMYKPDGTFPFQAAARVAQFDGSNFNWLTHSFFPFVNHDENPANVLGYTTLNPVVAMTTRQICFAAKGIINSTNNATTGPDSLSEQTVYTVVSHPAPVAAPQPVVTITPAGPGNSFNLSWNPEDGLFTVQTRPSLSSGSWANVTPGNVAPPVNIAGGSSLFVRLVR